MSKKIYVTMSKADYAELQNARREHLERLMRDSQANSRPERPNSKPQPQAAQGGGSGPALFLLIVVLIFAWGAFS